MLGVYSQPPESTQPGILPWVGKISTSDGHEHGDETAGLRASTRELT